MKYLILQNPGHNRVYYNSSAKLALAELNIACCKLSVDFEKIEIVEIEGIRYLSFRTNEPLSDNDIRIISRLSFIFAFYSEEKINDKIRLHPIKLSDYQYIDDKISSILKYQGKTNELFTKMMVNVALLSSDFEYNDKIRLLDPMSGRGTTLFEAMIYGFDAYGVEIEQRSVHDAEVFFKKYLEEERLKHTSNKRLISGSKKADPIYLNEFEFARTKEEFKTSKSRKRLGLVCGNTQDVDLYFHENYFHLIVGDLPYGIQHSNTKQKKGSAPTRNPYELLESALNAWFEILKPGGTVVMAWNSNIVSREEIGHLFTSSGFDLLSESPYSEFEHKVDRSIKRDIIVVKKTS